MNALRNTLAILGGTVLLAFTAWHLLLWRMGEVYRRDQLL